MGRAKRGKRIGGRRDGGSTRPQGDTRVDRKQQWWLEEENLHNARLEKYYQEQRIIPDGEEFQQFLEACKKPLPTSFRITAGRAFTSQILRSTEEHIPHLSNIEFEGERPSPPRELPWYPRRLGWQFDVKKSILRKQPEFKSLQGWLVHETESGTINRQEAVSMIPPLFLNVQHDHLVLDMCAAPGSKTGQLLEAVHAPLLAPDGTTPDPATQYQAVPLGLVIANDSDAQRVSMLKHQVTRLPSPNLMVTNCDARFYPNITVPYMGADGEIQYKDVRYDRILADVPCSGDGTMRKNQLIWKDWTMANGLGLHKMQLQILIRAMTLLAPGGRLVYSTCSLNPIENEAVVAGALREAEAAGWDMELIDTMESPEFEPFRQLKRRPGLHQWKVCPLKNLGALRQSRDKRAAVKARAGQSAEDEAKAKASAAGSDVQEGNAPVNKVGDEAPAATEDANLQVEGSQNDASSSNTQIDWVESWADLNAEFPVEAKKVAKTLWPHGDEERLKLERCMRVYPHLQNTGGFFVAVLHKRSQGNRTKVDGKGQAKSETAGMAEGIKRALDRLDELQDEKASKAAAVSASESTAEKRARSPTDDAESESSSVPMKKAKAAAADESEVDSKPGQEDATYEFANELNPAAFKEDAYSYVDLSHRETLAIQAAYSLPTSFIRNLLVRNLTGEVQRMVYYTNPVIRAILTQGPEFKNARHKYRVPVKLRLIFSGNKIFARQGPTAGEERATLEKWRIVREATDIMKGYMPPQRIVKATLKELMHMLQLNYPKLGDIEMEQLKERLSSADTGSYILEVDAGVDEGIGARLDDTLSLALWRAPHSVNIMLEKQEKSAISFRIFGRDVVDGSTDRYFTAQQKGQKKAENALATPPKAKSPSAEDDEMFNAPAPAAIGDGANAAPPS
ncbi:S-adenosyl-L-methionine-dependent methyltransferase [Tilletiaria anomala UBC 951]|uniref:S-adenosyl-L-methionine-dependent methyltransferase n=1 Tax=Tilletiaria anomala (strain ATCC 24038 / CBS 436.72 / UBC 951) TaxID=1037660 RepID=A0A066VTQ1_TILAU|nr:S-adenosyl-L-methionine-dependent methyltransferase [Tilletiaria anomala UBC 951]KDN43663.1 S-adenosyl-L-methionine-dependent methyltransferase [Tilletiaria anomala UBC 951]